MITSQQAKESRLKLGFSQNFIAKETGLSRPYLSNFEAGTYNPNKDFLETLEAFFKRHGIELDNQQAKEQENIPKQQPIKENQNIQSDNKIIDGIIVNTNEISFIEAEQHATENNLLNDLIFSLQNQDIPIKKGLLFNNVNVDLVDAIVENTIKQLAQAYIRVMLTRGSLSLPLIDDDKLPNLEDLTNDDIDDFSIADYLIKSVLDCESIDDLNECITTDDNIAEAEQD